MRFTVALHFATGSPVELLSTGRTAKAFNFCVRKSKLILASFSSAGCDDSHLEELPVLQNICIIQQNLELCNIKCYYLIFFILKDFMASLKY